MTEREVVAAAQTEAVAGGFYELAAQLQCAGLLLELRDELRQLRLALVGTGEEPPCTHPAEARRDLSSMGEVEFICGECKEHVGPLKKELVNG